MSGGKPTKVGIADNLWTAFMFTKGGPLELDTVLG